MKVVICLSGDNDLAKAVFCEKESEVTKLTEQVFNLAIIENVEQWVVPRTLHFDYVGIGQMISTEECLRTACLVKECKHKTARLKHLVDSGQYGRNERLRKIICCVPEDNDVEYAAGKVEIALKKSINIEAGWLALFAGGEPLRFRCLVDNACHID